MLAGRNWSKAALMVLFLALTGALTLAQHANAQAMPESYTVNSRAYEIITDLPRDEIRPLAAHMDAMAQAYDGLFRSFESRNSDAVRLYLWSDRDQYLAHGRAMGTDLSASGGVFFRQRGETGVATWVRGQTQSWLLQTLQHEGFHQFAHKKLGDTLPLWTNEGLAVYFQHALLVDGRLVSGVAPGWRIAELRGAIERGEHFGFAEMLGMSSQRWWEVMRAEPARASLMYTQAWSMVQFLIHGDNGKYKRAFEAYLRRISEGWDHTRAFEDAFKTGNKEGFEARWVEYIDSLEADPLSEGIDRMNFMAEGIRMLHEAGEIPGSIDDLKHHLQRRGFRTRQVLDGVVHVVEPTDEMFSAPGVAGRGSRGGARLELRPARIPRDGNPLPPNVLLLGLRVDMGVEWYRTDDGELEYRVVFD